MQHELGSRLLLPPLPLLLLAVLLVVLLGPTSSLQIRTPLSTR